MSHGFLPGVELSADFYATIIAPLLVDQPHAAALLGTGSDVLGFDTAVSTDHGWGPRLHLFVPPTEVDLVVRDVTAGLPEHFRGWPVRFGWDGVPIQHHVRVTSLGEWLRVHLGRDPRSSFTAVDWLTTPQQALLEVTRGRVHADADGELSRVRNLLAYFPPDVQRWLLACQWERISQEESFVGRAAQVGDELGSRLIATRIARDLMRLGFLLAREYWPYTKWFGTAFARLPIAAELSPMLGRVVGAPDFPTREAALVDAYGVVARAHNASGLTAVVDPGVRPFHERPFLVLGAGRFAQACRNAVVDPWLRTLPLIGSVDQLIDSTDVLASTAVATQLRALYSTPRPG